MEEGGGEGDERVCERDLTHTHLRHTHTHTLDTLMHTLDTHTHTP
jgi:hypothetical protein